MPSHLTRSVFRGLISNEGLILRCQHRPAPFYRCQNAFPSHTRATPQRTLFGFSVKPQRKAKDPDIIPGFANMTKLNDMEKLQARPPPPEVLAVAFNEFVNYKIKEREPINNIQAQHLFRTYKYLQRTDIGAEGFGVTPRDLTRALRALTIIPNDETSTHVEFGKELYIAVDRGIEKKFLFKRREYLLKILASTGNSADARTYLERYYRHITPDNMELHKDLREQMGNLWTIVLSGFASENNEAELLRTLELALAAGTGYLAGFREVMTMFYASRNNVAETKSWLNKEIWNAATKNRRPKPPTPKLLTPKLLSTLLKFSLRNNELDWCKSVFRDLIEQHPPKPHWDVIFQWAAGALGKGVEDVKRMMEVMVRRYPNNVSMRPDSETINGLVELAMSLDDPYLAERYISLGLNSGIRPNARTCILQMEYRIRAGDLTGAETAYKALQGEEITENEDITAINKYIRALCTSKTNHYDRIVSIIADLDERHARLEAETVSDLCKMYLRRGELFEVVDILRANAFHQSLGERASICDSLLAFCLDRSNAISQAWDTYTILRSIFPETDRGVRTQLMNEFFARKRCDMACHVFGHMRQHDRREIRPVCETYVECFEGIAKSGDRESLDMVHNMLKLDVAIEPTTRLYNSLMLAYTACDDAYRALDFWTDITNSREGPSYNSLEIVFLTCAKRPFGDKTAREIWGRMRRMDIEVTPEVFAAFGAALAGQGKLDEVKSLIEGMEQEVGYGPDALTIGTFYNYTMGQNRKDLIEAWAKERYPELWAELEKLGQREDENTWRYFNIAREVKA